MLKPQRNAARDLVSLDGFWDFRADSAHLGHASAWSSGFPPDCELAVPGSWNEQRSDLTHYFGRGWYQTRFFVPEAWKTRGVWLRVGSAQARAEVWLNGRPCGGSRCGWLPFECDLGAALRYGEENRLVIEVDGGLDAWDLPPARLASGDDNSGLHDSHPSVPYDFFPYSGLARPVSLVITESRVRLVGVRVITRLDASGGAELEFAVTCEGANRFADFEVQVEMEGHEARARVDSSGRATIITSIRHARRWDVGRPELYTATLTLFQGQSRVDQYRQTFGVREIRATADALLLNGRPVFLAGFGKHEDFAIAGRGLFPPVVVRDFDLMRWVGANSFRTSHYPYAEEWYDFADRTGVLVIAETPLVGLSPRMYTGEVLQRSKDIVRQMVARDCNHPSIVTWSLANEPNIDGAAGVRFFEQLAAAARAADPSRPITYVGHGSPEENTAFDAFDLVCVNKYFGWYENPGRIGSSLHALGATLDAFRARFNKPVLLTEFGADAIAGLHTEPAEMFSEEFQAELVTAQFVEARKRPWVVGTHVWAFADFKTAQSITRVALNRKGVFTRDRQPKLVAHRLRALWNAPMAAPAEPAELAAPCEAATAPPQFRVAGKTPLHA